MPFHDFGGDILLGIQIAKNSKRKTSESFLDSKYGKSED
jgi:hypothetical protein